MDNKKAKQIATLLTEDVTDKPINWENVARAVDLWLQKYRQEVIDFAEYMRDMKEALKDPEFGGARYANIRMTASIPERLDKIISAIEPNYRNKQNLGAFLKRFPMFQLPDKR